VAVNIESKIAELSAARRKKVESGAAQLIAEEMTLRELRQARKLTHVGVVSPKRTSLEHRKSSPV
jgi:hypothetical protein